MSKTRLDLQSLLESKLGSRNVYYQAPPNNVMKYPCILYERNDYFNSYADNIKYRSFVHYSITLIGKEADNEQLVKSLLDINYCSYNRQFKSDNLYHDIFDLYW